MPEFFKGPERSREQREVKTFGKIKEQIGLEVGAVIKSALEGRAIDPQACINALKEKARELRIRASDIQISVENIAGNETRGTIQIGNPKKHPEPNASHPFKKEGHGVVLIAALLNGACTSPQEMASSTQETSTTFDSGSHDTEDTDTRGGDTDTKDTDTGTEDTGMTYDPNDIVGSGSGNIECDPAPYFDAATSYTPPEQVADISPPNCGESPEHAPDECGVQQWLGYSENNPAAVSWMAIANTGNEPCTVTITRLELSYKSTANEKALLDCGINWSQRLSDGTKSEYGSWGTYISDSGSGTTFEIPPNTGAYVHPFGNLILVPEDAQELTITFSAEITPGCVASGGMDTYSEFANPDEVGHNIIFEAMKTPWVTETVKPENPISYSIVHVPTGE